MSPPKMVATPVRRSTRRSCAALPVGLRDHDTIVESVDEVVPEMATKLLFRDNHALNLAWRTTQQADDDDLAAFKSLVNTTDCE